MIIFFNICYFFINRFNERELSGVAQTETMEQLLNYKAAIQAINEKSDPNEIEWPIIPWR